MMQLLQYIAVGYAADALLRRSAPSYFVAGILYVTWKSAQSGAAEELT